MDEARHGERGGGRTGQPRSSSGLQPQVQGQQAGTFASAAARGRCVPEPCGQGAERRHGTVAGAGAQLHWHREGTQGWCRQRAVLRPKAGVQLLGVDVEVEHENIAGNGSPERGQAARWSPSRSTGRRRSSKARKTGESRVSPWLEGKAVRTLEANGPDWDSSRAREGG